MISQENYNILKASIPFWESLTDSQEELLVSEASLVSYGKNQIVHSSESECAGMLFVLPDL